MSVEIIIGDCRASMAAMDEDSIDSCVCDPPYHLQSIVKRFANSPRSAATENTANPYGRTGRGFMGQTWDGGDVAFDPETWAAVYRVLKPGAHLVAFSGTRTYHRMVCAIEDAGFEIRDQLAWVYGSGFPKSHDVSKGIDRMLGAERELVGVNKNWRSTKSNIACPQGVEPAHITAPATPEAEQWAGWGTALKPAWEPIVLARKPLVGTVAANVLEHGTGALNIDGCRVGVEGGRRTEGCDDRSESQRGAIGSYSTSPLVDGLGRWPANILHDGSEEVLAGFPDVKSGSLTPAQQERGGWAGTKNCYGTAERGGSGAYEANDGSAARFFYCAKAASSERGEGNGHPTVKPIDLMRWLCRLVTPKGGTVLDPFMGSGSTLIAADREQFSAIGCELSDEYAAIARRRIDTDRGALLDAMEAA